MRHDASATFCQGQLSYAGAVRLATAWEAAERDAAAMDPAGGAAAAAAAAAEAPSTSSTGAGAVQALSSARGRGRGRGMQPGSAREPGGCRACGSKMHRKEGCRFRHFICSRCSEPGHLRRVCPQRGGQTARGRRVVNHVAASQPAESDENNSSEFEEELNQLSLNNYRPVSIPLSIDGVKIDMEVDTGSAVSCVSKATYLNFFSMRPLERCQLVLKFYDGSKIKPLGMIKPVVSYGGENRNLELYIIDGGTTSLLGRQWLAELNIKIPSLRVEPNFNFNIEKPASDSVKLLLDRHEELFSAGLGRFTGGRATLRLRPGASPVFCSDAMLREGIIEPVDASDWATPLVPNKDLTIRIGVQ